MLFVADYRTVLYDGFLLVPYLGSFVLAFLALRLNAWRAACFALALATAYAVLREPTGVVATLAPSARASFAILSLELALVALTALRSRWLVGSRGGALAIGASVASFGVAYLLVVAGPRAIFSSAPQGIAMGSAVPAFPIALALLLPGVLRVVRDRFWRDFAIIASFSLFPTLFGAHHAAASTTPLPPAVPIAVGFISATTVLAYATFRLYWHKIYIDELTGIPNRRALNDRLQRLRGKFAIAMIDIDHFKRFNDTWGHEQGDHVLRFVAKHFEQGIPGHVYRYGGEELCVVLADATGEEGVRRLDDLRKELAAREFRIRAAKSARAGTTERRSPSREGKERVAVRDGRERVTVTVSVGVAASSEALSRTEDVLIAADSALYRAKSLGRNRTLLAAVEPAARGAGAK
jgi:diguanylate cyclase (GGDEF)-like protein